MTAKIWTKDLTMENFTYDFAVQGGAVGTILLGNLPDGFVITQCVAVVQTVFAGGGTIVLGEDGGGDDDGYFTNMAALAVGAKAATGALVNASGVLIPYQVAAAKDGVAIKIATTAFTAGKIQFSFLGYQPKE